MMKKAFACLVVLLIFCAFSQDVQTPKILEAVAVPDPSEQGPTRVKYHIFTHARAPILDFCSPA